MIFQLCALEQSSGKRPGWPLLKNSKWQAEHNGCAMLCLLFVQEFIDFINGKSIANIFKSGIQNKNSNLWNFLVTAGFTMYICSVPPTLSVTSKAWGSHKLYGLSHNHPLWSPWGSVHDDHHLCLSSISPVSCRPLSSRYCSSSLPSCIPMWCQGSGHIFPRPTGCEAWGRIEESIKSSDIKRHTSMLNQLSAFHDPDDPKKAKHVWGQGWRGWDRRNGDEESEHNGDEAHDSALNCAFDGSFSGTEDFEFAMVCADFVDEEKDFSLAYGGWAAS